MKAKTERTNSNALCVGMITDHNPSSLVNLLHNKSARTASSRSSLDTSSSSPFAPTPPFKSLIALALGARGLEGHVHARPDCVACGIGTTPHPHILKLLPVPPLAFIGFVATLSVDDDAPGPPNRCTAQPTWGGPLLTVLSLAFLSAPTPPRGRDPLGTLLAPGLPPALPDPLLLIDRGLGGALLLGPPAPPNPKA